MKQSTNAQTERVLGQYGTVEEAYKPKDSKRVSRSMAPKRMHPTAVTAQGAAPSQHRRKRLAEIERQQAPKRQSKPRGGNPRYCEFVGRTQVENLYGIKVKVTGIKAEIYWLPYYQASALWYEICGTDLADFLE